MTMFAAWVVFPLVLGVVTLGLGLLVDHVAGGSVPAVLLLPVGSATLVATASLGVAVAPSRVFITAAVAGLAACGLVLGGMPRIELGALAAAGGVFVSFGAAVLASGTPTFAGYIKLDDTATFLALADRALEHGRSLAGLAPSSYEATLGVNLAHGYPLGSVLPLAIGHELVRVDTAWIWQPWLSWNAAMLALSLFRLSRPLVRNHVARSFVAFVSAQPALLYGFAQWGGVKELVAAALVATAVALAAELDRSGKLTSLLPLAVVTAALVDSISLAALIWLLPLAVLLLPVVKRRVAAIALGLALMVVLSLPALAAVSAFFRGSNRATFTDSAELGNLVRPLHLAQVVGVWPSGDFRFDPSSRGTAWVLLAVAAALVVVGVGFAARERARGLLLAIASAALGVCVFVGFGSPWVGAKALAVASPFVLLAAAVGAAGLCASRGAARSVALFAGVLASLALVTGVAWSNGLAYHDATLAPYGQLAELQRIGSRFAGDGPALLSEYQPYGVRHFLRSVDAEGVSELRRRPIALIDGRTAAKGQYVDIDEIRLPDLLVYRTLVLRKSPTESRPPAAYRLVWSGRWYRVWQRGPRVDIVEHRPLGDSLEPGARASCAVVDSLASAGTVLSYPRSVNRVWPLDGAGLPHGWSDAGGGAVVPQRGGAETIAIAVPSPGRYRIWLGGSVRGRVTVAIDGSRVGTVERQLQNAGQWLELGRAALARGTHDVSIAVSLPALSPGTGGGMFPLGPLLLEPIAASHLLEPSQPRAMCGRNLDWIEARSRASG